MRELLVLLALSAGAAAQQQPEPEKKVQRIWDIKYVSVRDLADILQSPGATVRFNENLRTISYYGTPAQVEDAEGIIKRFDVAKPALRPSTRNIELTFHMIMAGPKGTAGEALPPELDGVVTQLKNVFGFADFRLLDAAVMRNRENTNGETNGHASGNFGRAAPYRISHRGAGFVPGERGNVIRIDRFEFSLRMPMTAAEDSKQVTYSDVGFNTNLDIREGQKVVVGKAKVDGSDRSFILVISAKALE